LQSSPAFEVSGYYRYCISVAGRVPGRAEERYALSTEIKRIGRMQM
jgi:hypothetical protein